MDIATLAVILIIAAIAALVGRAFSGYTLSGCLVTYVAACLGAVGGWYVQRSYLVPDQLLAFPLGSSSVRVSVVGAAVGALLLAVFVGLLGRPRMRSRRRG